MPMFKTTAQIFTGEETFSENWTDHNTVQTPSTSIYDGTILKLENVELWEVIVQHGGGLGVYAAWLPYGECYIVTGPTGIVAEFSGVGANRRLEQYLIANNIDYPKS